VTFLLHLRRNIARNQGRTLGLMLVVGLTLGIFLVLGQVSTSISAYSGQVVASVPNIITVAPANTSIGGGYFVGLAVGPTSTGLNSSMISTISKIANIQAIQRVYNQPLQLPSSPSASSGSFACGSASNPGVLVEDTTSQVIQIFSASGASVINATNGRNLGP
jgi:hypothetical protein